MSARRLIEVRRTDGGPIDEKVCAEAIQPGRLLQILSGGTVQHNDLVSLKTPIIVALANVLAGKETGSAELAGGTETSAWTSGDTIRMYTPRSGDLVALRLADGQTAVIGSRLAPSTGGYCTVITKDSSAVDFEGVFGQAEEALDMSDSSAVETTNMILVRII